MMYKGWSNLSQVVTRRTYLRDIEDLGRKENWWETVDRYSFGNTDGKLVRPGERDELIQLGRKRKGFPAGRGIWASGSPTHKKIGGTSLNNCWYLSCTSYQVFPVAMDLLMLGGGVGMSVRRKEVSQLPKVKRGIRITHVLSETADIVVEDSREGWVNLFWSVLESYFETGRSFSWSSHKIRPEGSPIRGFGGTASGPDPLIKFIEKVCSLLDSFAGEQITTVAAGDLLCMTGEMVKAGNVRRSAIILIGDAFDRPYLLSKRWDLGQIPSYRSSANYSVYASSAEELGDLFWETYENGEPFGIVNPKTLQEHGRMGEHRPDTAHGVNPCVPAGTEILTREGYRPIDTLVGSKVHVWNGFEWSEVEPKITGYDQELVTVYLSSGQSLTCTRAHKFEVSIGYKGHTDRVAADKLEPGMKLIKTDFPVLREGVTFERAYAQGFFSGDGFEGYKYVHLYGDKIKCAPRIGGRVTTHQTTQDRHRLYWDFEPMSKAFVPMTWDLKSRLDWLAGLLDSDGCELKEGGAQISSVDRQFLLNTQKMLTTLGTQSKVTLARKACRKPMPDGFGGYKEYDCKDSYRLLIGAAKMQALKQLGLRCERLSFEKTPNRDASQFVSVVDIEEAGIADVVYCFTEHKRNLGCFEGVVTGQCAEATLESYEPCNLVENALPNLDDIHEFEKSARLLFRYAKRVTLENYHIPQSDEVIKRNRRVGVGITGCLQSSLYRADILDHVYRAIQKEDEEYSRALGVPTSIKTTVIKPSGTVSKMADCPAEGIHPGYSRYLIQRIRLASNDPLIPLLKRAGHFMEPERKFDGTVDPKTLVVDFYVEVPSDLPVADEHWDTWKQLEQVKFAQKYWADQAVSVTVYYRKEEIPQIKQWLESNLHEIKTISFLCHNDHGFDQAPKEAISKEKYEELSSKIRPIEDFVDTSSDLDMSSMECAGGFCPVK